MARQGKGILGAPSKSIGVITGQKHYGKDTIRSKPKPSIKTQTQELATTKTNFQIANEFYEQFPSTNWVFSPNMKGKNQSFRNLFVGAILKALSIKESGTYKINPIPPTYNFMKFKTVQLIRAWGVTFVNRWGYLPYPLESREEDMIGQLTYNQTTNSYLITWLHTHINRGNTINSRNYSAEIDPGDKAFVFTLFINPTRNTISNAILNLYIRPL